MGKVQLINGAKILDKLLLLIHPQNKFKTSRIQKYQLCGCQSENEIETWTPSNLNRIKT